MASEETLRKAGEVIYDALHNTDAPDWLELDGGTQNDYTTAAEHALQAVEADIKAEALEEAATAMGADPTVRDPLRLKADWLRNRAAELRADR